MVGLSDAGLYQRSLLLMESQFRNTKNGPVGIVRPHAKPALSEPLISLAFDLQQGFWVARGRNFDIVRGRLMGALSGGCTTRNTDLVLQCPRGDVIIHQYFSNDAPRADGKAFRGTRPDNPNKYAQELFWVRYSDPAIMTPFERFTEMLDRALRKQHLKAILRDQLGGLVSPDMLLMMAGTLFVMFGAQYVGGKVAVVAVASLLDIHQFACSAYFYEPRLRRVHEIAQNAHSAADLEDGASALAEVLSQMLSDMAAVLGIHALGALATRLFKVLCAITPQRARTALQESIARAEHHIRTNDYGRRNLLKDPAGTPLEPAAIHMYEKTSEQYREVLVVREPDVARAHWIKAHHVWNRAKPPWLKAKSGQGWHGLVCLTEAEVYGNRGRTSLQRSHTTYKMGNLRGVTSEIDAAIARHPEVEMFDMPTDGRDLGKAIDYENNATGHNHVNLHGHKLVKIGDKFIIVDGLGVPYISDLDLATRQQPGTRHAGEHLPEAPQVGSRVRPSEDNWLLEYRMNQLYAEAPGAHPTHGPSLHGGGGATVKYTRENLKRGKIPGKDFWSPVEADGHYKKERLIIFLPELVNGRIKSNMYVLESWQAFKEFAHANKLEFPF